jgi:hypothetical protein
MVTQMQLSVGAPLRAQVSAVPLAADAWLRIPNECASGVWEFVIRARRVVPKHKFRDTLKHYNIYHDDHDCQKYKAHLVTSVVVSGVFIPTLLPLSTCAFACPGFGSAFGC